MAQTSDELHWLMLSMTISADFGGRAESVAGIFFASGHTIDYRGAVAIAQ